VASPNAKATPFSFVRMSQGPLRISTTSRTGSRIAGHWILVPRMGRPHLPSDVEAVPHLQVAERRRPAGARTGLGVIDGEVDRLGGALRNGAQLLKALRRDNRSKHFFFG
jgi:hypothetical protein